MNDERSTFESLAQDLGVSVQIVRDFALKAGINVDLHGYYLSHQECDRIYDVWLYSNVNASSNKLTDTPAKKPFEAHKRHETKSLILIDTSSLLRQGAMLFLKNLTPNFIRMGQEIIVPLVVIKELQKHSNNRNNPELAKNARRILDVILEYQNMGVISVYGDDNDGNFADKVFLQVALMLAPKYNLLVITQDKNLSQDLLRPLKSVNYKKIKVCKIDGRGRLSDVKLDRGVR